MIWSFMNENGSQFCAGQFPAGVPHVAGIGAPEVISDGIASRGKKNTEIPEVSHFTVHMI
jgi:hypothetical protein